MRLLRRWEYLRVQRKGRKLHTPSLLILVLPNRTGWARLGIAVSKKFGNSVKRNRIKRVLREVFRRNQNLFPRSIDLVIIPKRISYQPGYNTLVLEIGKVASRFERP